MSEAVGTECPFCGEQMQSGRLISRGHVWAEPSQQSELPIPQLGFWTRRFRRGMKVFESRYGFLRPRDAIWCDVCEAVVILPRNRE